MKALEVSIDGRVFGFFATPAHPEFFAMLGINSTNIFARQLPRNAKTDVGTNALEVSIDGSRVGVFVPPTGSRFFASLHRGAKECIIARVSFAGAPDSSSWSLPTVHDGQRISFSMIDSPVTHKPESQIIRSTIT